MFVPFSFTQDANGWPGPGGAAGEGAEAKLPGRWPLWICQSSHGVSLENNNNNKRSITFFHFCAVDHALLLLSNACSDPDCAVLCLLAADDADDVALQIHFTLMQAFFHENDFPILRVWGLGRLQQLLGAATDGNQNQNEHQDFHCVLVTVSCADANDTM